MSGDKRICFESAYAAETSASFSTSVRPRTSTELFGEEIRVIPWGTDPVQPGPQIR